MTTYVKTFYLLNWLIYSRPDFYDFSHHYLEDFLRIHLFEMTSQFCLHIFLNTPIKRLSTAEVCILVYRWSLQIFNIRLYIGKSSICNRK